MKLEFYTPDDIPSEVLCYNSEVKQLGVGKTGKNGSLRLVLEKKHNGKTIVTDQFSEVPLYSQRALHYEESIPDMAHLYIISPSGGILQGDRYRTDIFLKKDATAHITTQGATRIYSMETNTATQQINVTLDEGSYLELIPDQIIPYRNSRYYQKLCLKVHDTATMVYSEIITPGRVAMGESFEYDICYLKTKVLNQEDNLQFLDIAKITPKKQRMSSFGLLSDNTIVGTIYILSQNTRVLQSEDKFPAIFEAHGISAGVSRLPNEAGIIVRMLGQNTEELKKVIYKILEVTRKSAKNASFGGIRKN